MTFAIITLLGLRRNRNKSHFAVTTALQAHTQLTFETERRYRTSTRSKLSAQMFQRSGKTDFKTPPLFTN